MNAVIEGLKEFARLIILGVVSYLSTEAVIAPIVAIVWKDLDVQTRMIIVGLVLTILKSIDKWLHKDETKAANGLLPF